MNLLRTVLAIGLFTGFAIQSVAHAAGAATTCESLAKLALPNASVTLAKVVAKSDFNAADRQPNFFNAYNMAGRVEQGSNPAFCQVAVTLKPSADSDIRMEVWLPQTGWNGKFLGIGNFGWGGAINYAGLLSGLQQGYAVASNDTGHQDQGGQFLLGHPEKLIDYAYRADHEMTVESKTVVQAFYGAAPDKSYWAGCSLGGLEGLIEAKRYPADYDAMIVGAPPNPIVDFNALQIWPAWLISQDPSRLIPQSKFTMIHDAVIARCASVVGKHDGLVEEPDKCDFDPESLLCKGADAPDCLTAPQVYLLEQEYQGPKNPRTGAVIFPGQAKGAELTMYSDAQPMGVALDLFRYAAFQNPNWDFKSMDWDKVLGEAEQKLGPFVHVDSKLGTYFDRGGKMLLYIGWNDSHNPEQLIGYTKSVIRDSGAKAANALRLFIIPGMGHCGGGEGCDTFDRLRALDQWVASGKAPTSILAMKLSDGAILRSRPICAYPAVAKYNGTGNIDDATNFVCTRD